MPKRILVIDDDPLVRESVAKILRKEGYDSILAGGAEEALKIAQENSIDLVISDIRMPGTNGVETIRKLRNLFDQTIRKDIPIIFITGYADLSDQLKAEHFGEVILKPFDLDRLVMTIKEYL